MRHLLASPVLLAAVCVLVYLAGLWLLRCLRRRSGLGERLAADLVAWLARESRSLDRRLAGYRHELTWQMSGRGLPSSTGTCGQCRGSVVLTQTRSGECDVRYDFPGSGGTMAHCRGAR